MTRKLNCDNDEKIQKIKESKENACKNLYSLNLYHAGIFECTKKLIIYYGKEDENVTKKPLSLESKNENEL